MEKIDLVYLWVDGNDEKFRKKMNQYRQDTYVRYIDSQNECRYRDNQELKYSLRSVAKNAPWINKIFIVTNGQVPEWFNQENDKIELITHKQIMPEDALPTFNSEAIETCIANIPGLSEYFLYANDDSFISKPVSPNYFFDKSGNPIIRLTTQDWTEEDLEHGLYQRNITNVLNTIYNKFGKDFSGLQPTHNIDAYRKSYFKECIETFKDEFNKVCHQRFREENSAQRLLVGLYMVCVKGCTCKVFKTEHQQRDNLCLSVNQVANLSNILKHYKSTLFCLNDNQYSTGDEALSGKFYLSKLFPENQLWEKAVDVQIEPISSDSRAIVFAPDNNYFKYFAVALESIIQNSTAEEKYDIIVFDSDISANNKNLLQQMLPDNFSVRYFNMRDYIQEYYSDIILKNCQYWSESMYYKCFIPIVMKKYSKVLYLDVDICAADNLSSLFDIDFEGKQIFVVRDTVSGDLFAHKNREKHFVEELGMKSPESYFNSGVVLFNNKLIDEKNYFDKFKKILSEKELLFPDQDILNIIFEDNKKLVSCKYNCQYGVTIFDKNYIGKLCGDYKEDFLAARRNPVIIHYTSSRKPWHSPSENLAGVFWNYAKMTPFYEVILYENIIKNCASKREFQNVVMKRKIYINYFFTKFMETFTFGKLRKKYRTKRVGYKRRVKELKQFAKI